MIRISLREFLDTGAFGPVKLGMSHVQVEDILGPPESTGGTSRRFKTPVIWLYGDIELHFERDNGRLGNLNLIYLDHFDVPSGGQAIDLDPWIIQGGMSLEAMSEKLELAHILHQQVHLPYIDGAHILTSGEVLLSFIEEQQEFGSAPGLYAICRSLIIDVSTPIPVRRNVQ